MYSEWSKHTGHVSITRNDGDNIMNICYSSGARGKRAPPVLMGPYFLISQACLDLGSRCSQEYFFS